MKMHSYSVNKNNIFMKIIFPSRYFPHVIIACSSQENGFNNITSIMFIIKLKLLILSRNLQLHCAVICTNPKYILPKTFYLLVSVLKSLTKTQNDIRNDCIVSRK